MFGRKEIEKLKKENQELRDELLARTLFIKQFDSSLPNDYEKRKAACLNIHTIYQMTLKKQLANMIAEQAETLALIGTSEKLSDIYRSNINCLRLIDEWFESRSNEYLAMINEGSQELENQSDFISGLVTKYGNNQR